jgi:hypothetical protein
MSNQEETYRTSDLYYAAYLKVAEVPFIEATREGDRVFFVFQASEGLRDLKNAYYNRTAKVSALTYADEIRTMKALTHATCR